MNKIIFIIGASGSGKTTLVKKLEKEESAHFRVLYFDSIQVPSFEEMQERYGGPEEWQRVKTIEWVEEIKKNWLPIQSVVLDGQTRPSFIEEACQKNEISEFEIILLDCSDDERKRRLIDRGDNNLADVHMMRWAEYLRKECQNRGYCIIDTTHLTIKEVLSELSEFLHEVIDPSVR